MRDGNVACDERPNDSKQPRLGNRDKDANAYENKAVEAAEEGHRGTRANSEIAGHS